MSEASMMDNVRWIYRAWRYRLLLERPEIRLLFEHLAPGDTVLDIGAHKGAYTYWMSRRVGSDGSVIAFEPQRELARRLQGLLDRAGIDNVRLEELALSSRSGTMEIALPVVGTSPGASLEPEPADIGPVRSLPVMVMTVDEYLRRNAIATVHFVKCDAEGHELEVFRGAERLLRSCHPRLLFECEARHRRGGCVDEVFAFLENLGYRGWGIGRKRLIDLDDFDSRLHQAKPGKDRYVNNFLFLAHGTDAY